MNLQLKHDKTNQNQILAATPHSSSKKALPMLGLGRQAITPAPTLPEREAMDVAALTRTII